MAHWELLSKKKKWTEVNGTLLTEGFRSVDSWCIQTAPHSLRASLSFYGISALPTTPLGPGTRPCVHTAPVLPAGQHC